MGNSSYSQDAANFIRRSNSTKSTDQIFQQNQTKKVADTMSPIDLKFRESRDSDAHPESLAIMVNLDVTGSMGQVPVHLIKETLPKLMEVIIKHGTPHPHVMFNAIGDQFDSAPLQVGQFEAGAKEMNDCLSSIWLEGNGQGGGEEAYSLAHMVAARHTSLDCYEKRGIKGVFFTIGDEAAHPIIKAERLAEIMGYKEAQVLNHEQIIEEASRMYHIFHIHVQEGSYRDNPTVIGYWKKLLPERVIIMDDYTQLAEIIGATVAMVHGADLKSVVSDFDSRTAQGVTKALAHIESGIEKYNQKTGVINL